MGAKIGIIADTHDNVPNIKAAVEAFKEMKVDFVVHLGDIIAPQTTRFFKGLKIKFVKGNCDGADMELLKSKIAEIGGEFYFDKMYFEFWSKKFICIHKPDEEIIKSGEYDYVLYGHTHKKRNEKIGKTRVINPGAHYYGAENTIAILDIEDDEVEFIEVKG